jgi:hypothetical protein
MKQDRVESNTRQSGGQTAGRHSETAAGGPDTIGRRENLLEALRECYGIANGEARNGHPSDTESNPVAALLRKPLR